MLYCIVLRACRLGRQRCSMSEKEKANSRKPFLDRVKHLSGQLAGFVFFLLVLFFGCRGCIGNGGLRWSPPKEITTYSSGGSDTSSVLTLLPDGRAIIWFQAEESGMTELVLLKLGGEHAWHYVGPLWNIGGIFGWRFYEADSSPIMMRVEYRKKYLDGRGDPVFPRSGTVSRTVVRFRGNAVCFEGRWFRKGPLDNPSVPYLLDLLEANQP